MMGARRAAVWACLLLICAGPRTITADERGMPLPDYNKALSKCGRSGPEQVSFLSAFGALWPVPVSLVLVDASNNQVEYSDLAFPWYEVKKPSRVFFGGRTAIERRWPDLFTRPDGTTTRVCSLQVTRYANWESFDAPVVIVSNSRDHLLLVGPISNSADAALGCYASTARLRGIACN